MDETVNQLLAPEKGILALDWSPKTIAEKFSDVGLISTPELNRVYRQMLLTTPGIENYISGVIFHEQTAKQKLDDGTAFPDYLIKLGIVPGIKVDQGAEKFGEGDEEATAGIEGLKERLEEYKTIGLKFAKWRAVFKISDTYPTDAFVEENLKRLVEYCKICIGEEIVPIAEPEISMKGNHTTTRCAEITTKVLLDFFNKSKKDGLDLGKVILKTNMILPGQDTGIKAEPLEVAEATLRVLRKTVPSEIPGIVFLSGGQSPDEAVNNLNEIVKRKGDAPWELSFSYARALQGEALKTWHGDNNKVAEAQKEFLNRLKKVAAAKKGDL